jgi:hypothetical protein
MDRPRPDLIALLLLAACAPVKFRVAPDGLRQRFGVPTILRGRLTGTLTNVSKTPQTIAAIAIDHVAVRSVTCGIYILKPMQLAVAVAAGERPSKSTTLAPGEHIEFPVDLIPRRFETDTRILEDWYVPPGRGRCSVKLEYRGAGWVAPANPVTVRVE